MAGFIDLTGQQFGDLTVLEYAGDRNWKCKCSCGNEVVVGGNGLRRGTTHSCGHDNPKAFKDITGQKFGEWTVLEPDKQGYWKCRCSCGTERSVGGWHLRGGRSKSCGHGKTGFAAPNFKESKDLDIKDFDIYDGAVINKWTVLSRVDARYVRCRCSCGNEREVSIWALKIGKSKSCGECSFEDLTGKQFGDWKVLRYMGGSNWECECTCGEVREVNRRDLMYGKSKSCGSTVHRLKYNLIGQKFGMLTAIRYLDNGKYECICDCGNTKEIMTGNLISGSTVSCGCKHAVVLREDVLASVIAQYESESGQKPTLYDLAEVTGYNHGYIGTLIKKYNMHDRLRYRGGSSIYEKEILKLIYSINPELKVLTRQVYCGFELDIYIPDKKIAIEFNGDYWHSTQFKDKYYHVHKTNMCDAGGIRLIHIFEYEWRDDIKKKKIEQMIRDLLGQTERIFARECTIKDVTSEESEIFMQKYHLQNNAGSDIRLGLYHKEDLVAIMTFGKPRFTSDYYVEYEMIRYCVKYGVNIVGGARKIFKHFVEEYNPNSIVTYSDRAKFTGKTYERLGLQLYGATEPGYVWVNNKEVLSRYQTQKHKLVQMGLASEKDTEDDVMTNLGFLKIYNCGNAKYVYNKDVEENI